MPEEIKFKIYGLLDETNKYDILDPWDPNKYPDSFWYGESLTSLGYTLEDYPREEFKVVQYTGVTDNNGKEIFEGDIVKIHAFDLEHIAEVIFKDGMYGVQWKDYTRTNAHLKVAGWFDDIEVIGNTYENPELLDNRKHTNKGV